MWSVENEECGKYGVWKMFHCDIEHFFSSYKERQQKGKQKN